MVEQGSYELAPISDVFLVPCRALKASKRVRMHSTEMSIRAVEAQTLAENIAAFIYNKVMERIRLHMKAAELDVEVSTHIISSCAFNDNHYVVYTKLVFIGSICDAFS